MNFNFCTQIPSIDRNKSPLQISGKVGGCIVRTLKTFQGTHILGASRGLFCDSYAVLFSLVSIVVDLISDLLHFWQISGLTGIIQKKLFAGLLWCCVIISVAGLHSQSA